MAPTRYITRAEAKEICLCCPKSDFLGLLFIDYFSGVVPLNWASAAVQALRPASQLCTRYDYLEKVFSDVGNRVRQDKVNGSDENGVSLKLFDWKVESWNVSFTRRDEWVTPANLVNVRDTGDYVEVTATGSGSGTYHYEEFYAEIDPSDPENGAPLVFKIKDETIVQSYEVVAGVLNLKKVVTTETWSIETDPEAFPPSPTAVSDGPATVVTTYTPHPMTVPSSLLVLEDDGEVRPSSGGVLDMEYYYTTWNAVDVTQTTSSNVATSLFTSDRNVDFESTGSGLYGTDTHTFIKDWSYNIGRLMDNKSQFVITFTAGQSQTGANLAVDVNTLNGGVDTNFEAMSWSFTPVAQLENYSPLKNLAVQTESCLSFTNGTNNGAGAAFSATRY